MVTDSYFEIGYKHDICQDYALAGKIDENTAYAIITDGCSSSHDFCRQLDVGARILAYSAINVIKDLNKTNDIFEAIRTKNVDFDIQLSSKILLSANDTRMRLGLIDMSLDCTLLIAISKSYIVDGQKKNKSVVLAYGDGDIVFNFNDGSTVINSVDFPCGAPFYLNYFLNKDRKKDYIAKFEPDVVVITHEFPHGYLNTEDTIVTTSESFLIDNNYKNAFTKSWYLENLKSIILFSDGVRSFECVKDGSNFPVEDLKVIRELIFFKNLSDNFIKRRVNFFHKKTTIPLNWKHFDDMSEAGIVLGE